jgi:hypothetical protein
MGTKPFEAFTESEQLQLVSDRKRVSFVVAAATAGVGDLTGAAHPPDMPTHAEVPPSSAVLSDEGAMTAYVRSGDYVQGRWLRLVVLVYRLGGRILYRKLDQENLETVIDFRQPTIGDKVAMATGNWTVQGVTPHEIEVCPQRYCIPSAIGHSHTRINRGLLIWDRYSGVWRVGSGSGA